ALRRAEGAIGEVVVEQAVGVSIGVTAMAAEPGVVREAGVVKKQLAALFRSKPGQSTEADVSESLECAQVDNGNGFVKDVGEIAAAALVVDGEGGGPASDADALADRFLRISASELVDAGERDEDFAVRSFGDAGRIARAAVDVAELVRPAV